MNDTEFRLLEFKIEEVLRVVANASFSFFYIIFKLNNSQIDLTS